MTTLTDRCDEAMARAMIAVEPCAIVPKARAARLALLSELDAAGWQLAPRITTDAMEAAAFDALEVDNCKQYECATDARIAVYTAMLAAAPHPFPEDKS